MSIEQALEKLENIASKLEKEDLTLDESLALFDEGTRVAETCAKILSEGKGKLVLIKEKLDKITEENFNLDD